MPEPPLTADPDALHAAGLRCETAAHSAHESLTACDAAARGCTTGFSETSGPALDGFSAYFDARRDALTSTMSRLGTSLQQAAQAYRSTDAASARSIDSAGSGLNLEP